MALRMIDTNLWKDPKVTDNFTPEDKYFWVYLLTCDYGNLSGVFEISLKQISRDMGYSEESVRNLIYRFTEIHKMIAYNYETQEAFIFNWYKYNWTKSPLFEKSLLKHTSKIKCVEFKEIVEKMYEEFKFSNTVSIPYRYHTNTITITNSNTNNISNNTNNILKEEYKKINRFKKPTIEEVEIYCKERNNNIDAEYFINYYESKDWMIGKNRMKDWKAAIRTWEKKTFNQSSNKDITLNESWE